MVPSTRLVEYTKILGSVHVRRLVHYQKKMVTLVKQKYITKKNGSFWYSMDTLPKILVTFGKARIHYQTLMVTFGNAQIHYQKIPVHYQTRPCNIPFPYFMELEIAVSVMNCFLGASSLRIEHRF